MSSSQVDAAQLQSKYSKRVIIKSILTSEGGGLSLANQKLTIGGWVKTGREQGKGEFAFLEVNDGSSPGNLQVIVKRSVTDLSQLVATGTSVMIAGTLKETPPGTKQKVELHAEEILHVGLCDASAYPIAKTKLSLEYLRTVMHLRARTNTISAIARIRSALAYASHTFFSSHGFLYVHTPIVTTSDCEGAGEMFQVTTLLSESDRRDREYASDPPPSDAELAEARADVAEKGAQVKALKEQKAAKDAVRAAVEALNKTKEVAARLEERSARRPGLPRTAGGAIDYSADFFARQAFLTVSGQLQVETYACALSSVYTFGPTFRAENSHTTRHLAEFWMIEPEMAFADLEDDMNCAEDYIRYLCQYLLDHCLDDLSFLSRLYDKGCIARLESVAAQKFERLSYTAAVELLQEAGVQGHRFLNPVEWGTDLASEHERYLSEVVFQKPVIVHDYPKAIKAFYMRENEDGKTVAAMDVLVPGVGELVGGSQREERYDVLERRLKEVGLPQEPYEWYLDLRRFGTVKHSGFGLGFERMILFATGIENIRDVIPFPRFPGKADL